MFEFPVISVIIPVYNTAEYLPKCLDSVLGQTFRNIEILIINDGSNDGSAHICDLYAKKDIRIRVFHIKNGGVSNARNIGLDNMKGQYVCFVDSDDYIEPNYIEDLYCDYREKTKVCLVLHNILIKSSTPLLKSDRILNERGLVERFLSGDNLIHFFLEDHLMRFSGPVAKLFQVKIIKQCKIHFPIGISMGEDAVFYCNYLLHTEYFIISNKINYIATRRSDSLVSRYNSFKSEWEFYSLLKESISQLLNRYPEYLKSSKRDVNEMIWRNTQSAFVRSVQSVFKSKEKISLTDQVRSLLSIPIEDYAMYIKYYETKTIGNRINKFLISKRYFLLFCLIGNLYRLIRR